jgi:hypothetical protein
MRPGLLSIQLALGKFMSVQAQLGVVREVGTELQEKSTEALVDAVEIVVVHQRCRFDDPGIAGVFLGIVAFLGAVDSAFLLRLANENDTLAVWVLSPQLGCDIICALPLFEGDQRNLIPFDELLDGLDISPRHRLHGISGEHLRLALLQDESQCPRRLKLDANTSSFLPQWV